MPAKGGAVAALRTGTNQGATSGVAEAVAFVLTALDAPAREVAGG